MRRWLERADRWGEDWVGFALPPARRAVAATGWQPDDASSYCARCGAALVRPRAVPGGVPRGGRVVGCPACRASRGVADGVVRLGSYAGPLREWIIDVKYRHRWEEVGEHLGRRLGAAVVASGLVDVRRVAVIPMPMPWQRRLYRGIDHAHVIAAGVARELRAPVRCVLVRTNGDPLATLSRTQRARAGGRGMSLRVSPWVRPPRSSLAGRPLLVVDDVATTGASIRAATRILRGLDPDRVFAAVLAVADRGARGSGDPGGSVRTGPGEVPHDFRGPRPTAPRILAVLPD